MCVHRGGEGGGVDEDAWMDVWTVRRGEGGMEVEGEGDYIPIAALSPPE